MVRLMARADFGELGRAVHGPSCSLIAHSSIFLIVTLSNLHPVGGVSNGLTARPKRTIEKNLIKETTRLAHAYRSWLQPFI